MEIRKMLSFVLLCASTVVCAEDIIQVVPFKTTAGVAYKDKKTLEISMTNTFSVANLQFDLLLPEGMTISSNNSEFTERTQTYDEDEDDYVNNFTWTQNVVSSGYTRIVFTPTTLNPIEAGSGTILKLRYKTDGSMAPGVYPILMEGIELDNSVTESVKHLKAASYVIIGDNDAATLDLSGMTNYVPSFVIEQLNDDLAANENIAIVNLSGATELGAELVTPDNVVSVVGKKGTLKREYIGTYWSTVCLPFALSATQVAALNDGGVEIEEFTEFDEAAGTVTFKPVNEMVANTPYIVRSTTTQSPFTNLTNVQISTADINNVVVGKMTFMGTFEKQTLNSSDNTIYYAYNASDGNFVRIGSNATVPPFRAYLKLDNSAGEARSLIVNHGQSEATGICAQQQSGSKKGDSYNLVGLPIGENSKVKGIYIQNGQKIVVR